MSSIKKLAVICLLAGIIGRVYLVFSLPLWHDEAFSIWASEQSILHIILGAADNVHPPGYYLFLKSLALISENLFWLRMSSVTFSLASSFILFLIGKKFFSQRKIFPYLLVITHQISGYFIIFDWQLRMYAGLTTLILFSYYLFLSLIHKKKLNKKLLLIFSAVNLAGLYFDYGFFWYFIPLSVISLLFLVSDNRKRKLFSSGNTYLFILLSLFSSICLFLLIDRSVLITYKAGINGIAWMGNYLKVSYLVPFFVGGHRSVITVAIQSLLLVLSLYWLILYRKNNKTVIILVICALISSAGAIFYSYYITPLFHIRSFQIVGIATIFLFSLAFEGLTKRGYVLITYFLIFIFILNFLTITKNIYQNPGRYMIDFLPWKNLKSELLKDQIDYVHISPSQNSPTPIFFWGIQYTLKGNEEIIKRPIPYQSGLFSVTANTSNCKNYSQYFVNIYGCKK